MYKTFNDATGPIGSQVWHSDSGPGTCVNVMYYLHDTDSDSGTLEALPWRDALSIYETELRTIRRRLVAAYGTEQVSKDQRRLVMEKLYDEEIDGRYKKSVRQSWGKAGQHVPFLNNTLHRGGIPGPGREALPRWYSSSIHQHRPRLTRSTVRTGSARPLSIRKRNPDFWLKIMTFLRHLYNALFRPARRTGLRSRRRAATVRAATSCVRSDFAGHAVARHVQAWPRIRNQYLVAEDPHHQHAHDYNEGVSRGQSRTITSTRRAEDIYEIHKRCRLVRSTTKDCSVVGPRNIRGIPNSVATWLSLGFDAGGHIDLYSTNPEIVPMNMEAMTFSRRQLRRRRHVGHHLLRQKRWYLFQGGRPRTQTRRPLCFRRSVRSAKRRLERRPRSRCRDATTPARRWLRHLLPPCLG